MAKYIDMEAARNSLYDADAITMKGVAILNNFPSADVEEVKHGKWMLHEGYDECNLCHAKTIYGYIYCPNCGAKMDGGKENGKNT